MKNIGNSIFELKLEKDLEKGFLFNVSEIIINGIEEGNYGFFFGKKVDGENISVPKFVVSNRHSTNSIALGRKYYFNEFSEVNSAIHSLWFFLKQEIDTFSKEIEKEKEILQLPISEYLNKKEINISEVIETMSFLYENLEDGKTPHIEMYYSTRKDSDFVFKLGRTTADFISEEDINNRFNEDIETDILDFETEIELASETENSNVMKVYIYPRYNTNHTHSTAFVVNEFEKYIYQPSDYPPFTEDFFYYLKFDLNMTEEQLLTEISLFRERVINTLNPVFNLTMYLKSILENSNPYQYTEQSYFI